MDGLLIDFKFNEAAKTIEIFGLEQPVKIKNWREFLTKMPSEGKKISVSVSDLRQALGQEVSGIESSLGSQDESAPVVAGFDLRGYANVDFDLVFGLLIREFRLAQKRNAAFVLENNKTLAQRIVQAANALYGAQEFIFSSDEKLPSRFQHARRITVLSVNENEPVSTDPNRRYLLAKALKNDLEKGELLNFRVVLDLAIFKARIERLETSDVEFMRFKDAYRKFLDISIENEREFILFLQDKLFNPFIIDKYALSPKPIPIDRVIQIYRLMTKMAEQSA